MVRNDVSDLSDMPRRDRNNTFAVIVWEGAAKRRKPTLGVLRILGNTAKTCSPLEGQARYHGHDVQFPHHDVDTRAMGLFPHVSWDELCIYVVRVGFDGYIRIEVLQGRKPPRGGQRENTSAGSSSTADI